MMHRCEESEQNVSFWTARCRCMEIKRLRNLFWIEQETADCCQELIRIFLDNNDPFVEGELTRRTVAEERKTSNSRGSTCKCRSETSTSECESESSTVRNDSCGSHGEMKRFFQSTEYGDYMDLTDSSIQNGPSVPSASDEFWNVGDRRTILFKVIRRLLSEADGIELDLELDKNCANVNDGQAEVLSHHVPITPNGEFTSVGTILHKIGRCKPCIFMSNSGKSCCSNGFKCLFCHHANHCHPKKH
eukprot:GHVP01046107.1.p1 GENE.GHVP01046107.1~~GHVP01046107.1.p1  ORF type:complete len:246 (+),score=29.27 GHVP01046107.1:1281-2018(+)